MRERVDERAGEEMRRWVREPRPGVAQFVMDETGREFWFFDRTSGWAEFRRFAPQWWTEEPVSTFFFFDSVGEMEAVMGDTDPGPWVNEGEGVTCMERFF